MKKYIIELVNPWLNFSRFISIEAKNDAHAQSLAYTIKETNRFFDGYKMKLFAA